MKSTKLNKTFLYCLLILMVSISSSYAEDGVQFFGDNIDFWHEAKPHARSLVERKNIPTPEKKKETETVSENGEMFPWQKYLDPKNKEFFKEGDYTPPEPFMEIVRNPTDANLKLWFSYIAKKNELSDRLQSKMREYMEKNGAQMGSGTQEVVKAKIAALPTPEPDAKQFRFRMYFDSHCPHCKKMFGTLSELQAKGFYVEARQVDSDPRGSEGLSIPTERATSEELKEKGILSVPLLLVGDIQKKIVYRLSGFQTVSSIFQTISQGGAMN